MEGGDEGMIGKEISEAEKSKIEVMRAVVRKEDEEEVDEWQLRRFLRARDMDVEKASRMFLKYRKWRRRFGPVSTAEIGTDLGHEKMFMQGLDREGRPIVVVFGGRHKPGNVDEFKRFVTFTLDKICAGMPRGQEKFTSIADLQGWGFYSNCDVRGYLAALSILQDCYPERLAKLFFVHVPSVFMAAWKLVFPFIDANTKQKIVFVPDNDLHSTLLSHIDPSQLPDIYGGKLSLLPIQDC